MKLATIVTLLALSGTEAIYYECCKTTSGKCPNVMAFEEGMEADVDGETFKTCCQPGLAAEKVPDKANLGNAITCVDDIDAGNGMSISAYGLPAPSAKLGSGTCCEIDAVVEPGKLRSSTSPSCPVNMMYSMGDAKGPNNNSLCCDAEDVSLDHLEDVGACSTMAAAITNTSGGNDSAQNNIEPQEGEPNENQDGEPAEGQEGDLTENQSDEPTEGGEGEPADDGESTDNVDDSEQVLAESNSASAASAAFVVALLGAAIQAAI